MHVRRSPRAAPAGSPCATRSSPRGRRCVRIPTLRAHAESITIETEKPIDMEKAYAALNAATGVTVVDDVANNVYPMPLTASKKYDVEVGRMRKNDVFGDNGLDLFVCGDQLLRGAALNAVLIAEAVCE